MDLPRVVSTEIVVVTRMRLEPEFLCTSSPEDDKEDGTCLCCRWTTETDRTIPQDRKTRAHYADSALQILRALKQCGAEAILAQGEAFVPCLMLCSETLRNYAYDRARVRTAQRVEHNATFYRLRYLLLHCPCAHPPYWGLTHVESAVGQDVTRIEVPAHLQIFALELEGDPYRVDFERVMGWISGHLTVDQLSRGLEPGYWGDWREDWAPELKERDLEPTPLLLSAPDRRMHQLVKTFMVPALTLELPQWKTPESRERIRASLNTKRHAALFVRESPVIHTEY